MVGVGVMSEDRLDALEAKVDEILALLRAQPPGRRHKDHWRMTEIDELDISTRLRNALVSSGIETRAEFIRVVDTGEIWHLRDLGRVSAQEAQQVRNGLR